MYLRNRGEISHPKAKAVKPNTLVQSIIFTIIIILAILFSSLKSYSSEVPLLDSLNSNRTVYFDFGKAELKEESLDLLNSLAQRLKSNPRAKIEIHGHTDNVGGERFNDALSVKRAEAVKAYLMQLGVNEDQLITQGEGFWIPVNDNSTDEQRALNRRVEFKWLLPQINPVVEENDESYANTSSWKTKGNEITGLISVRDTAGEPVSDITESDVSAVLKWQQNGVEDSTAGSIKLFPIDDKKKIAFTFTMDYSPSMYDDKFDRTTKKTEKIKQMEKAVLTFIDNMDSRHFAKIIKFGKVIDEMIRFTHSKEQVRKAVENGCYPRSGTAVYRSIYTALQDTTFNSNPTVMKAVIAFTDGEENSSGLITKKDVFKLSEQTGVKVYTVGLLDAFKHSIPAGLNSDGEADLLDIAKNTGGFYYWASDPGVLQIIYKNIYDQIMKSFNISIMWEGEKLPPKGTEVTAVVRVKVKGMTRTIYKKYLME